MTFRSKILIAAAAALLMPAAVFAAGSASPEKMALAKAYVATVPLEAQIKAAVEEMSKQVPAEQRVLFRQLGETSIDYARVRNSAEAAVAETFTDEEIKAMIAFYGSPEGKSVREKMPEYEAKMSPVMNAVMVDFVKRLQANNLLPQGEIPQ